MGHEATIKGGCLCGAVRYLAHGAPLNVRLCHCDRCRKASGGLAFGRAVFERERLEVTGETRAYPSSPRLLRRFCPTCGTLVFAEPLDRPQYLSVSLATLDDPNALAPDMHIWCEDKPEWLVLGDGLPQHPQGAPW